MVDKVKKDTIHGYEVQRSITFSDDTGFALAENPNAPSPFVTWQFTLDELGGRDYYWGNYFSNKDLATRDYERRAESHHKEYELFDADGYNYYSTQRPVDIGTFPKTDNGPVVIVNFDKRENVEGENFKAWGYLIYDAPLTEKQVDDYELRAASDNPYIIKLMMEQAQTVGKWEEMKGLPKNERFTRSWTYREYIYDSANVSPEQMAERYRFAQKELRRFAEKQAVNKPIAERLREGAEQAAEHNAIQPAMAIKKNDIER